MHGSLQASVATDAMPLRTSGVLALLAVLVTVLVPHVERIPVWVSIVVAALLAWRAWLAWRSGALPRKWVLIALAMLGTAGVLMSYGPGFGRDASVALLAFMLALKVLELKALRDATVVICLGFFLIITNFLYSQTIPTALYMLAVMAWLTATLVAFQDRNQTLPPLRTLRTAGTLMMQAAPLMLALFLLFPRVQGPIFGFPQATSSGVTGLSDSMSPGSLSSLGLSDDVAFRVQFHSPPPVAQSLYWRGPVLWDFDGRTWTMGSAGTTASGGVRRQGSTLPIQYTVTLEPHNMRWVFAIDLPTKAPPDTTLTNDYQLLSLRPIRNRLRYEASSRVGYQYGLDEPPERLRSALRLPQGYNPKTLELAHQIREHSASDLDAVKNVLNVFRTELFFYTLVPPELGRDSVDEFLFVTRRGFCEHYASAFVFLMRAAGVPARVVTGYQGGEMNPLGDYMIVRQSEAHAWAEVWLKDEGWVRVDPTAAVSPARIQVGIGAALPAGDPLPISVRGSFALLKQLRFTLDAVANSWNQWVLGYTPDRQMQLLRDVGFGSPTWQTLAVLLMSVAATLVGALALLVLRKLRLVPRDPVARAWRAFCRKLARRGTETLPGEGPRDFARRAAVEQPSLEPEIEEIAELYLGLRYAGGSGKAQARRLRDLVRAL
jgi:transglutaminase-like putative cysteine protease